MLYKKEKLTEQALLTSDVHFLGELQKALQEEMMYKKIRKMRNAFSVNIIRVSSHLWVNRKHGPTEKKLKKVLFFDWATRRDTRCCYSALVLLCAATSWTD
jgi:hypothetical protein